MQVNVAGLRRNIKNLAHNYSDAQVKVREATSNDPWGPSATIMAEIADLTYNVVAFSEIMQMIWKRLNDHGKNWRHVYKALILLEYLIKTGSEKVAQQCKENIFAIQTLREFVYFEEGKDQGTHVREKAKQLVNLLRDAERLKNERIKALKAKERFAQHPSGFGSDGYIDGPSHRDMPPGWQEEPKAISELEMVRPQTAGEEELQLQLAMAMSREEAEQEEAKRRSDDVRLQLALSQSEQDFKQQKKEEPQSHLLDLLDISLGATSISSPPQLGAGAVGGLPSDPWGTPARAASQLSDPWSGTSSPQIDPWQPAAARGMMPSTGAVGVGLNGDAWALRTQSPSVVSGSSGEGWLQNNGMAAAGSMNGNTSLGVGAAAEASGLVLDPWLSKTNSSATTNPAPSAPSSNLIDPWLSEKPDNNALKHILDKTETNLDDPWKPAGNLSEDPWKALANAGNKKISPDLDEFDIISNRNKTAADAYTNNSHNNNNNNNNHNNSNNNNNNNNSAILLDDMDPLAPNNASNSSALSMLNMTANGKKQLKTPQAFLGENSALVNLDNLIKPVVPQAQSGSAAYNPFSDTVVPPKTNLFQQQQPAVPSINQLKQQQPFGMTINQDPWAPVANANNTASQFSRNQFRNFDKAGKTIFTEAIIHNCNNAMDTIDALNTINLGNDNNSLHNNNTNFIFNEIHTDVVDGCNIMTEATSTTNINMKTKFNNCNNSYNYNNNNNNYNENHNYLYNNNNNNDECNNAYYSRILTDNHININNNNMMGSAAGQLGFEQFGYNNNSNNKDYSLNAWNSVNVNTYNNNSNNNNSNSNNEFYNEYLDDATPTNSYTSIPVTSNSYMSAFSASLAATPGVIIKPLPGTNLFSYGFYDDNVQPINSASAPAATTKTALGNCQLENNNNWMKPEATASNPFLS